MAKKQTVSVEGSKAIFTGTFQLGVLNFPVKLFSATEESESGSLSRLCPHCKGDVGNKMVCKACEKELQYGEIKKGYRVDKTTMLEISEGEMTWLSGDIISSIKGSGFVPESKVDILHLAKPYFLAPESYGDYSIYNLLVRKLMEKKMAIKSQIAIRNKVQHAVIMPYQERLVLYTLRFDNEVRDWSKIPLIPSVIDNNSLVLMDKIMQGMTLKEMELPNDTEKRFKELIEKKLKGEKIDIPEPSKPVMESSSMLEQLQAMAKAIEGQ
jgi:DNA end-binding protein Ku